MYYLIAPELVGGNEWSLAIIPQNGRFSVEPLSNPGTALEASVQAYIQHLLFPLHHNFWTIKVTFS
jgi:hypothetical protein